MSGQAVLEGVIAPRPSREVLDEGALLLRGYAAASAAALIGTVDAIARLAPFRRMQTPRGQMSVAMTACGELGWVSEKGGYRYSADDPLTGRAWPAMPALFATLAAKAAADAGFGSFVPDSTLINEYVPGTKLSLHQDKEERDPVHPVVSVSLGLPGVFAWGGLTRRSPVRRYELLNGDVVVFGGPSRLVYHGVERVADGVHPLTGRRRINLTFRRAR
ncbi:MAG: DNA oxidative demethylase AlkB [Acetobacteraceae bacterium]|nr:DNA oxidative demethylase AlkB [Acetobacteraceae bacterium]